MWTSSSSCSAGSSRRGRSCSEPSPRAGPSSPGTRSCSRAPAPSWRPRRMRARADLAFEAAVAGGIPLIRPLRESLAGDRVTRMLGIVNGTTNYILTQMSERGWGFDEALAEAQRLGYAEADPTADVDGFDAAAKCAILASIAFDARVTTDDVYREGIAGVTAQDIADAARLGYVVKLLAIAELDDEDISVRVHPAMVPVAHPLASVRDAFNAVFVEADKAGQLMFYGRGAGGDPTATSVVGDLVRVARHLAFGGRMQGADGAGLDAPDPTDGRYARPVLPEPARRGPSRRARRDRRGVRPPRRVDRARLAGGVRRGSRARVHHAPSPGGALPGDGDASSAGATPSARSRACCAWRARSERAPHARRPSVARPDRGVPGPPAGHRGDPRDHAARGRDAARPQRGALGAHRRRGLAEVRRREPDRARSRTAA